MGTESGAADMLEGNRQQEKLYGERCTIDARQLFSKWAPMKKASEDSACYVFNITTFRGREVNWNQNQYIILTNKVCIVSVSD